MEPRGEKQPHSRLFNMWLRREYLGSLLPELWSVLVWNTGGNVGLFFLCPLPSPYCILLVNIRDTDKPIHGRLALCPFPIPICPK